MGNLVLTVSTYRQISIAIRKKLVDLETHTSNSAGALQTCHSEETERQHYALTSSGLRSLDADAFEEFRRSSTAWYRFILGTTADIELLSLSQKPQPTGSQDSMAPSVPDQSMMRRNQPHLPPTPQPTRAHDSVASLAPCQSKMSINHPPLPPTPDSDQR